MEHKKDYKERIVLDPRVHFGKPCVCGTRIPVEAVLELIQEGINFKEIIEKYYPDLTIDDIKACARYATELVKHSAYRSWLDASFSRSRCLEGHR